ncbi:MAG TPA: AtpZ/AtpI family protein [Thermodesulfovibrionales bacterium]|nr:AtpZ/AtpI family protein [Thermodesulfovibrionales bacterium]
MPEKSLFKQLLEASTVGLNLVLSTFVGLAMGYGLDKYVMEKWLGIHTSPWLTIIFLLIGIAAGFRELFRIAMRKENESGKKDI